MLLTTAWLLLVGAYIIHDFAEFRSLKPDAVANFAAGAFAPLAFLWLVLGFFQQGEELRHSGQALWLQGRELQHSVEQQRDLVNVTREQMKFESEVLAEQRAELVRNAQPVLKLRQGGSVPGGHETRAFWFKIYNYGKPCTEMLVSFDRFPNTASEPVLPTGHSFDFQLELPMKVVELFTVTASYLDERLIRKEKRWLVQGANSSFEIQEAPGQC